MADVPPPVLDHPSSRPLLRLLALFGRGLVYSFAFWLVYFAIYQAPWSTGSTSSRSDEEARRQAQAWKSYDEQQARTQAQMAASEAHLKRMDALVQTEERLMARFEKVIESWERAVPPKR